MMYTSQEGEIYSGQARASGAVGVLPKSIRPIDVTKALYQLQLLPDRRDDEPSGLESVGRAAAARRRGRRRRRRHAQPVEALLKEQNLELRRFVVSTLDAWTHRIVAELRPSDPVVIDEEDGARARRPASRDLALGRRHRVGARRARGRRHSSTGRRASRPSRPNARSRRSRPRTRR